MKEENHLLAPKLVRTFFVSLPSVSLSSTAAAAAAAAAAALFLLFLVAAALPPPPPAPLAGVGALDAPSRAFPKLLDMGVGACDAGVEAGVCASCFDTGTLIPWYWGLELGGGT